MVIIANEFISSIDEHKKQKKTICIYVKIMSTFFLQLKILYEDSDMEKIIIKKRTY